MLAVMYACCAIGAAVLLLGLLAFIGELRREVQRMRRVERWMR